MLSLLVALSFNTSLPSFTSLRGIGLRVVVEALKSLGAWLQSPVGLLDSPAMRANMPALGLSPRELVVKLTKFVDTVSAVVNEPKKGLNDLAVSLSERLRNAFGCEATQCGVEFVLTTNNATSDGSTQGVLTARVRLGFAFERSAPF